MDGLALNIKFLEFVALELSVLIAVGATLAAGVYQIVHGRVEKARRQDGIAGKTA
jgi:hypothetical protein